MTTEKQVYQLKKTNLVEVVYRKTLNKYYDEFLGSFDIGISGNSRLQTIQFFSDVIAIEFDTTE